jgi:hypothetical protein
MEAAGTVRRPGRARAPILARIEKGAQSREGPRCRRCDARWLWVARESTMGLAVELLCSAFPMSGVDTNMLLISVKAIGAVASMRALRIDHGERDRALPFQRLPVETVCERRKLTGLRYSGVVS